MKCFVLVAVVGCGLLFHGCVEEKVNNANFKWSTNNNMPVSPKQTSYGAATSSYGAPTKDTKYRSMSVNDTVGQK